jgi:hypothetical protein
MPCKSGSPQGVFIEAFAGLWAEVWVRERDITVPAAATTARIVSGRG